MENEKIKLSDLLMACLDFKDNPTNENNEKIQALLGQFIIKPYNKLLKKQLILISILSTVREEMDASEVAIALEQAKVYYGIFSYVDNLDCDLDYYTMNISVIDLLYEFNIIDHILEYCEKDYDRLERLVNECVNFANLFKILEIPALMSADKLDEFIKTVASLKTDLTPEMLNNLKSIAAAGSPEWKVFKETVADGVYGNVMEKQLNDIQPSKDKEKEEATSPEQEKKGEPENNPN